MLICLYGRGPQPLGQGSILVHGLLGTWLQSGDWASKASSLLTVTPHHSYYCLSSAFCKISSGIINVTCLNHPEQPLAPSWGKSVFHETGPWSQKGWGLFGCCCLVAKSCPILLWPHGLWPTRLLCPWDFLRQEYWGGLLFPSSGLLLYGIYLSLLYTREEFSLNISHSLLRFKGQWGKDGHSLLRDKTASSGARLPRSLAGLNFCQLLFSSYPHHCY